MTFEIGSLVRARGREWVVLPGSNDDLMLLRPLGGSDEEVAGICPPLEPVESATFSLPDPARVGDYRSCRLLRDALRFSSRSGAGPFRSFSRIAVEPRPYQLVPLLLALRLNPVRVLIADDVGVGKTIEALLIARELLDRGEVQRMAVLCPPHLAEQWQAEMRDKFHLQAELVLPSTAPRLEKGLPIGRSLFETYPITVVSLDYIKSDKRRDDFARAAPELIIVDEAHTCALGFEGGKRHQRHALVDQLARNPQRHVILVTATPHSGNETAFQSLIGLLDRSFEHLSDATINQGHETERRRLATHFIQRRRGDLQVYMDSATRFPKVEEAELDYSLGPDYKRLLSKVLRYARETVEDPSGGGFHKRVRWWSALALLRSLASSPAALAETLRNRSPSAEAESEEEVNEIGRQFLLDVSTDEVTESGDVVHGADPGEQVEGIDRLRPRLQEMAREAEALFGDRDLKLVRVSEVLGQLLKQGFRPIVFCRFIPTSDYVAKELKRRLPKDVEVVSVTGTLPSAERETRVAELTGHPRRVLVATDCLSEGINLQEHFDAVIHYDLSWNPTRHEQRAGRVDRFGQPKSTIRVLTYYGKDNVIDGVVLDVLLRKHKTIRDALGITVPVPSSTDEVIAAIIEGMVLRQKGDTLQLRLPGYEETLKPMRDAFYAQWEQSAEREKRSRSIFAQTSVRVEDVKRELEEAQQVSGTLEDVKSFSIDVLKTLRAQVEEGRDTYCVDLRESPKALRDLLNVPDRIEIQVGVPGTIANSNDATVAVSRTSPIVQGLATYVIDTSLDESRGALAARAGVVRTHFVALRTTLLLLRFRFDLTVRRGKESRSQLVEETRLLAFTGSPSDPSWLDEEKTENLLRLAPDGNIVREVAQSFVAPVITAIPSLSPAIEAHAKRRAEHLAESHSRVRIAAKIQGVSYGVDVKLPVDVLGVYVYLPNPAEASVSG